MKTNLSSIFEQSPNWEEILSIIKTLHQEGFETYIVGGAVRDALLNKIPIDFDIATQAAPKEVMRLFPQCKEVGRSFGVILYPLKQIPYSVEIATFRKEGEYQDGRRPSSVEFSSLEEDYKRRDFTINALYYDIKADKVIDFVKGEEDLQARRIRTVGNPEIRFKEDKLRLMRALRFASVYNFKIEASTSQTLKKLLPEIKQIAQERVIDELNKTFKKAAILSSWQSVFSIFSNEYPCFHHLFPDFKSEDFQWGNIDIISKLSSQSNRYEVAWILIFYPKAYQCFSHTKERLLSNKVPEILPLEVRSFLDQVKQSLIDLKASHFIIKTVCSFYIQFFILPNQQLDMGQKLRMVNESKPPFPIDLFQNLVEPFTSLDSSFFKGIKAAQGVEALMSGKDLIDQKLTPNPQFQEILDKLFEIQLLKGYTKKEDFVFDLQEVLATLENDKSE